MIKIFENKIKYREEEFGGLVFNVETGTIFRLNRIGYMIFLSLYKGEDSIEDLSDRLYNEFNVERNKIKSDIEEFIGELINKNLASPL